MTFQIYLQVLLNCHQSLPAAGRLIEQNLQRLISEMGQVEIAGVLKPMQDNQGRTDVCYPAACYDNNSVLTVFLSVD